MDIFSKRFKLPKFQSCARVQPEFKPIDRVQSQLRQLANKFVKQNQNNKTYPIITNQLIEVCKLMNNLERRIYCFMTELERTKTNPDKYNYLLELYNNIKPDLVNIMEIYTYLLDKDIGDLSIEFMLNLYLKVLRNLRSIGSHLVKYIMIQQKSFNYRYQYEKDSRVPTCFSKQYPQVIQLIRKGSSNKEINEKKYELVSSCIKKKNISSQCLDLYDPSVARGFRDIFIIQTFMRIETLIDSIRKERSKLKRQDIIEQRIHKQEQQMNSQIFDYYKQLTRGSSKLEPKQVLLKNRKCSPPLQQKQV